MQSGPIHYVRYEAVPYDFPPFVNFDISDDKTVFVDSLRLSFIVTGQDIYDRQLIGRSQFL